MIYKNLNGNSSVLSYDIDNSKKVIIVTFQNGSYHYSAEHIGIENFNIMVSNAQKGYGLGSFIKKNPIVSKGFFYKS